MSDPSQRLTIEDSECIAETDKAILVNDGDLLVKEWIPKKAVHDDSEVYGKGHTGTLIIEGWFAKKQGWGTDE